MKWRLVWLPTARDKLAAVWVAASSAERQAITAATRRIELELERDADLKGEDFYGDRIFQYGPLAVVFVLSRKKRTVKITQVIRVREKN